MNHKAKRQPRSGTAAPEAGPAVATPTPAVSAGPFADASPAARQLAAAILEVLAGAQTPREAARTLELSLARYYQLELRALAGLVAACEDRRRKGRGGAGGELSALRRECEQLRRQCARQQALARATRRTVGLAPLPSPTPLPGAGKQRQRRPTARALRMAALLQAPGDDQAPTPAAVLPAMETVPEAALPAP